MSDRDHSARPPSSPAPSPAPPQPEQPRGSGSGGQTNGTSPLSLNKETDLAKAAGESLGRLAEPDEGERRPAKSKALASGAGHRGGHKGGRS